MQGLGGGGDVPLAGVAAAEEVGEQDGDQEEDQAHDGHPCTQPSHSTTPPCCAKKNWLKLLLGKWQ